MISGNLKVSYVLFQCRRRWGAVVYNCFIKKLFQKSRPTSHEIIFVEVPFNKVTDLDLAALLKIKYHTVVLQEMWPNFSEQLFAKVSGF